MFRLFAALLFLALAAPLAQALDGLNVARPSLPSSLASASSAPRTFLMPEEAFKVSIVPVDLHTLNVNFSPAPGYYLYRDRIKVSAGPAGGPLPVVFPKAERKEDPSFGTMWVYHEPFTVTVTLPDQRPQQLAISWQGCAEHGICYPPTTQDFSLKAGPGLFQPVSPDSAEGAATAVSLRTDSANPNDFLAFLKGANPLWVLASFFGFGLLLALTPCVLPMIPILSGIIAGENRITKKRAFTLSLTYVLGMAATYAFAGILAGLTGTLLSNALQKPPVLIGTATLFVLLSLSMFDVYQLQMPATLQGSLNTLSARLPGGRYLGVGLMGVLSALVVGPCVAAPLAGGLLYIAQTRDVTLGGSALFTMALGMGVPLLVIGTSAGALLPKAGPWTVWVKRFFGILLVGVAIWIVTPLLPSRSIGDGPRFQSVHSVAELDQALRSAALEHRPVMLDFYADWCVSCVEMEKKVFPEQSVRTELEKGLLLRADVTGNSADDQALLSRFGLFGPPGTIFFGRDGQELDRARLAGFVPVSRFLETAQAAFR
jgi:thiol:disulfide interchange protein DsbD